MGLELAQGPIVSALLEHDFFVLFPVQPTMLARYRSAFTPSRAKDDPTDAELALELLELLLRHPDKLQRLEPESAAMRALRKLVEARRSRRLLRARRRLRSHFFAGRPSVILGPAIITEMACIAGTSLVRDELEFLRGLPDAQFLRSVPERIHAEVFLARGAAASVFLEPDMQRALLEGATLMPKMWQAEHQQMESLQRTFVRDEEETRRLLEAHGDQSARAAKLRAWFADDRTGRVREAATALMRRDRDRFGLGANERSWPRPEDLPTLWGLCSYRLARAYLFHRDRRRLDANDLQDWTHYMAAMHADVLVTDDGKFRGIVEACPEPKPRILGFTDWIDLIV